MKMGKIINRLKSLRHEKKIKVINLKLSIGELTAIKSMADKFTGGNLSAWIRFASIKHTPKKTDLIEDKRK